MKISEYFSARLTDILTKVAYRLPASKVRLLLTAGCAGQQVTHYQEPAVAILFSVLETYLTRIRNGLWSC